MQGCHVQISDCCKFTGCLECGNLCHLWEVKTFLGSSKPSPPWRLENHQFSGPGGRPVLKAKVLLCLFWLFKACLKYIWRTLVHLRRSKLLSLRLLLEKPSWLGALPLFCSPLSIAFLHSKACEKLIGIFFCCDTNPPLAKISFSSSFKGSWLLTKRI